MTPDHRLRAAAAVVLLSGLALTGCSSSAEDTQAANAEACQSLAALRGTVAQVTAAATTGATTDETVTVGEAKDALQQIDGAWDDAASSLQDVSEAIQQQFEEAQQQYVDALKGIDESETLPTAAFQVENAKQGLAASYEAVLHELGC